MRLCILEDEPIILAVLAGIAAGMPGVKAQVLCDPVPAMECCRSTSFELLIVDHQMTGVEVTGLLRAIPDLRHVPIIMVTADNDRGGETWGDPVRGH